MVQIYGDSLPHDHPRLTTLGSRVMTWQGKPDIGHGGTWWDMVGHGLTGAGLWCPGGAWSLMYRDAGSCTHIRAHMSRRVDICAQKRTYGCLGQLRTIHTPTHPHPHTSTHVMTCLHARACVHMYARATRGVVEPRWVCARAHGRCLVCPCFALRTANLGRCISDIPG